MPFFDSHAHLSSRELLPEIDSILERAMGAGVDRILNICTDPQTLEEGLILEEKWSGIKNSGATTPHDVAKEGEAVFPIFEEAARAKKLAAIGETGLDYYYPELEPQIQKRFLKRYLRLAADCQLPVIFHCRNAFSDLFSIADDEYPKGAIAILHCFTGSVEEAEGVLERGWFLSFSGIVTFKKSEILREVAKMVPLKQLLIETDSPYLAPQSQRGKRNEPAFLPETAQMIASVKGISMEEVALAAYSGGRVFGFDSVL